MKKKLFLVVCALGLIGNICAMEKGGTDGQPPQDGPTKRKRPDLIPPKLLPNAVGQDPVGWFLTYLCLSSATKTLTSHIPPFSPSVQILDGTSLELVAMLQRLTRGGEDSGLPNSDIKVQMGPLNEDPTYWVLAIKENDREVCRFLTNGQTARIVAYNKYGTKLFNFSTDKGTSRLNGAIPLNYTFDAAAGGE